MCLNPLRIPNPSIPQDFSLPQFSSDTSLEKFLKGAFNMLKNEFNFSVLDSIRFERNGYKKSDSWRYSSHIYVPCRRCTECVRSQASQWRFRLAEESRHND